MVESDTLTYLRYVMNLLPKCYEIIHLDKGFAILEGTFKIRVCYIFKIYHEYSI